MNPELEKIRKVEIRNIIAKLQAGKTLTGPERDQLNNYYSTEGAEPVKGRKLTWSNLATFLGVNRRNLQEWRKEPDAPQTPDAEEWKEYVQQKGMNVAPNKVPMDRESLLREKLRREIALLDLRLSRERREVIPAAEIDTVFAAVASMFRSEILQWCQSEIPSIAASSDISEVRAWWVEKGDEVLQRVYDGYDRYLESLDHPPLERGKITADAKPENRDGK